MAILSLLTETRDYFRIFSLENKPVSDGIIFRLHYKVTTGILFVCCLLLSASQYLGNPIHCVQDSGSAIPQRVIEQYCWITGTFTLPFRQGLTVLHPGVVASSEGDEVRYHSYYQWVPFTLFLQGLLFHAPHTIWLCFEDNKVGNLSNAIQGTGVVEDKKKQKKRLKAMAKYFDECLNSHKRVSFGYVFCLVLNLCNVLGNMFLIDRFLDNAFFTYGIKVLSFSLQDSEDRVDPMAVVFPQVTKCTFYKYGPTGDIQIHDSLCILALNVANEKIYIFLWFWLLFLATLATFEIIYEILLLVMPCFRIRIFKFRFQRSNENTIIRVLQKISYENFYLLQFIAQNVEPYKFDKFLEKFLIRLEIRYAQGNSDIRYISGQRFRNRHESETESEGSDDENTRHSGH